MVTNSLQCKLCCLEKNVAKMSESYLKSCKATTAYVGKLGATLICFLDLEEMTGVDEKTDQ